MQLTAGLAKQTVAAGTAGGVLRPALLAPRLPPLPGAASVFLYSSELRSPPPMAPLQAGPAPLLPPAAAQPPPLPATCAVRWLPQQAGPPQRPAAAL